MINELIFPSKNSFAQVHEHLMIPVVYALKDVEQSGFQVDLKQLEIMEEGYVKKLADLENSIRSYPEVLRIEKKLNKKFNMRSGDQVCDLFFEELDLSTEGIKKTKTGKRFSTDKSTIEALKDDHPIVGLMNQYKKYGTLYSMFIKPARKHISDDCRVHCIYLPITVTGRLVSMDPNLQQVPKNVKAEDIGFAFDKALNIKNMYVPFDPDYDLMEADYSQMELRILAAYSQDPVLTQIFLDGLDVHLATGQSMADIAEPGVIVDADSKWRKAAKAINFGIIYGKGDDALARDLKTDLKTAQGFKATYFEKMPEVKSCIEYIEAFVLENKYVTTMFGNYRRLNSVSSTQKYVMYEALRQAVNMPIQGTAGQYTLCAIINLIEMLKRYHMKSRIVATVHDSIIFCRHKSEQQQIAEMAVEVMASPKNPLIYWDMPVPLVADLKFGSSWATLAK